MTSILEVEGLETHFPTRSGLVKAVNDVSFSLDRGELLGLVGESGCGKSITALSILRLIYPPGTIAGGSIRFKGEELLTASEERMRQVRGNDIAMIFQDPMTSLNPVFPVGEQIAEALRLHRGLDRRSARKASIEALKEVAVPSPERRIDDYPHQLSGGMRQRVMIAMALACDPEVLIADEPTTALDVTIQAQILELLDGLRRSRGLAILLITHDLGVVAESADRVCVMYTGKIVEESSSSEMFADPKHPYTKGLLNSIPKLSLIRHKEQNRLSTIDGVVPNPTELPPGCHFGPRCEYRMPECLSGNIPLFYPKKLVSVRCLLFDEERSRPAELPKSSAAGN